VVIVEQGQTAPDFELEDQDGRPLKLSSLRGSPVVLYFYPKADLIGEIHFGGLVNQRAHEPIVAREVWLRAQRASASRGRRAKSDRLLARLGVLRCGTCRARMVVGSAHHGQYAIYRCPPNGDCAQRVTISAEAAERVVEDAVRAALADVEGRAAAESNAREAQAALALAQADLDAAFRAFAGFGDEQAARERLAELRATRNAAQERVDHLLPASVAVTVSATRDWDLLTLAERRALIRVIVHSAAVAPGRSSDRITIKLSGE
jgi:hypothetical protein